MYIIGIDIGKNHQEATIIDDTGDIIGKSIKLIMVLTNLWIIFIKI